MTRWKNGVQADMSDYIKREDAINAFEPEHRQDWYTPWIVDELKALPSADVAPVRHGIWAETVTDGFLFVSCSACGFKTGRIDYNYCPNCGAKMDEGGNNGTDNK